MFGYIRTQSSDLRLRDFECYRACYCGLCRTMGSCTGQCSRLTLNYDFAFLSVLRLSLTGEKPEVKKVRCLVHPLHRRKVMRKSPQLVYCADASALLTAGKLADDLADEHGLGKFRARLAKLFLSGAARRAKKRNPELASEISKQLARLRECETSDTVISADEPAAIFGELMRTVASNGLDGSAARIAGTLGDAVGRWIYFVDAVDDFEKDKKRKRFNPFLRLFGSSPTEKDWESVRVSLGATLAKAQSAFELIDSYPYPELREVLANALYVGMPCTVNKILPLQKEQPEPAFGSKGVNT